MKADVIKKAIVKTIEVSKVCEVEGDMLGSARSLLKNSSGIACILGTGANSCVYNGNDIVENIPSLGYILTDWGGGSVLGKDFLSLVLQENLPAHIIEDFFDTFMMSRSEILDNIYNKPLPNRFLASFAPFLLKYGDDPQCRGIITGNFKRFFEYYVCRYSPVSDTPHVSFTGSIALISANSA